MGRLGDMRRVLRQRNFRYLWLAQSASVVGDNIVLVALALFVVQRTHSATDLGLVLAAHALSLTAFLLLGGVLADRLPRHRVMVATDLIRFALHALLAVLIFHGSVAIWQVVAIELVFGAAEAFFRPAAGGLLPQTVDERDIQEATAITTMSGNVAEFAGPALATALVLGAGAGWAFALDASTFLASALLLARVRPRARVTTTAMTLGPADRTAEHDMQAATPPQAQGMPEPVAQTTLEPERGSEREGMWAELREGSREVRSRAWVWATLASFAVALFCGLAPWYVLGPVIAHEQYGHLSVYGFLETSLGLGTIVGSILGISWRPRYPMRMAMLAAAVWPLSGIMYALGAPLVLVLPAALIAGVNVALFDVWWMTALAERIPPDAVSRVSAFDWMVSGGLTPFGYLLAGPLASRLGSVTVMAGGSALAFVAFALGLLPHETRTLERLPSGATPVKVPEGVHHFSH